jgi:hypothetical protein
MSRPDRITERKTRDVQFVGMSTTGERSDPKTNRKGRQVALVCNRPCTKQHQTCRLRQCRLKRRCDCTRHLPNNRTGRTRLRIDRGKETEMNRGAVDRPSWILGMLASV